MFAGRIALFGGTFDPVHVGHLRPALEVAEVLGLARVDFLPASSPPHKLLAAVTPFAKRVAMLRAAIGEEPLLGVCTLEAELPSPSYTWNTALEWEKHHAARPIFIIGDTDFAQWPSWRNGLRLPDVTDVIVMPRSGSDELFRRSVEAFWPGTEVRPDTVAPGALTTGISGGTCLYLPVPRIEVSSTDVRDRIRRGASLRYLVPDAVITMLPSVFRKDRME